MTTVQLNAVLASVVVTLGFWMLWGEAPLVATVAVALGVAALLIWRARSVGLVWAWATLLLGVESLAWPIVTMVQVRMATAAPSDEQMGQMLVAVLFGLFSSIFWLTFSYGIFKRLQRPPDSPAAPRRRS